MPCFSPLDLINYMLRKSLDGKQLFPPIREKFSSSFFAFLPRRRFNFLCGGEMEETVRVSLCVYSNLLYCYSVECVLIELEFLE